MTTKTPPKAAHGGARAGAGRPRKPEGPPLAVTPVDDTPLAWLLAVMRDDTQPTDRRMACAVAALPYCHAKAVPATQGKKDAAQAAASVASKTGSRFAPSRPPSLEIVKP
jgi:hypothetical protein